MPGTASTALNYDHYGNLTQAGTSVGSLTTYTYDLGDRLTGITPPTGSAASFTFDALGRHLTRSVGSSTDTYAYLGSSDTVASISTGSVTTASLLDASGSRLANADLSSGVAAFSLPDLHGDLGAAELTSSTTVADAIRYDGYGQTIASGGAGGGPAQPYRYQGRLDVSPDAAEPLYDLSARFYQPSLGAFTQLDSFSGSVQDPLSLNRYLYAEANPATLIDPSGHVVTTGTYDTSPVTDLSTPIRVVTSTGTGGGGSSQTTTYLATPYGTNDYVTTTTVSTPNGPTVTTPKLSVPVPTFPGGGIPFTSTSPNGVDKCAAVGVGGRIVRASAGTFVGIVGIGLGLVGVFVMGVGATEVAATPALITEIGPGGILGIQEGLSGLQSGGVIVAGGLGVFGSGVAIGFSC